MSTFSNPNQTHAKSNNTVFSSLSHQHTLKIQPLPIPPQTLMGCCFSTPTKQTQNKNQNNQTTKKNHHHEPPPPLEAESVKEVLSETPITKPQQVPILTPETKTLLPLLQDPPPNFETKSKAPPTEEVSEVVSQLSETCSISESFSAATTATTATAVTATTTTVTVADKREEDEATSKIHKWD